MTNINFDKFRGEKVDAVKAELENLGFSVVVTKNIDKTLENSIELVVLARKKDHNTIELIVGNFTFIS